MTSKPRRSQPEIRGRGRALAAALGLTLVGGVALAQDEAPAPGDALDGEAEGSGAGVFGGLINSDGFGSGDSAFGLSGTVGADGTLGIWSAPMTAGYGAPPSNQATVGIGQSEWDSPEASEGSREVAMDSEVGETLGAIEPDILHRIARQHRRELLFCAQSAPVDPSGAVELNLVIDAEGSVASATVGEATVDDSVSSCMARRAYRWVFPSTDSLTRVELRYVFEATAPDE